MVITVIAQLMMYVLILTGFKIQKEMNETSEGFPM